MQAYDSFCKTYGKPIRVVSGAPNYCSEHVGLVEASLKKVAAPSLWSSEDQRMRDSSSG